MTSCRLDWPVNSISHPPCFPAANSPRAREIRPAAATGDHHLRSPSSPDRETYLTAAVLALGMAVVGTMMCAYFVPFHITHGPPALGSVGSASSWAVSVGRIMTWGGLT